MATTTICTDGEGAFWWWQWYRSVLQMTAARMSFSSNNTYIIYDKVCAAACSFRKSHSQHHSKLSTVLGTRCVVRALVFCWLGVIFRSKHTHTHTHWNHTIHIATWKCRNNVQTRRQLLQPSPIHHHHSTHPCSMRCVVIIIIIKVKRQTTEKVRHEYPLLTLLLI